MEHSTEMSPETTARRAAMGGLAVVGFFALVFIGMVLAIYAARFVPQAANGVGGAATYLSSIFNQNKNDASLQAVQQTIPFGNATSTVEVATTTKPATTTQSVTYIPPLFTHPVAPVAGSQSPEVATPIPGSTHVASLYGLPNLVTTITGVGYLDTNDNFIPSGTISNSQRLAFTFTIANNGTNSTGPWHFSAAIPTNSNSGFTYQSNTQQSLNPGDHIDFTMHLDAGQARAGSVETISVTADSLNEVIESNESNTASATINVTN